MGGHVSQLRTASCGGWRLRKSTLQLVEANWPFRISWAVVSKLDGTRVEETAGRTSAVVGSRFQDVPVASGAQTVYSASARCHQSWQYEPSGATVMLAALAVRHTVNSTRSATPKLVLMLFVPTFTSTRLLQVVAVCTAMTRYLHRKAGSLSKLLRLCLVTHLQP